jgi:hypothetical protein
LGGIKGFSKAGGILELEIIWKYYNLIVTALLLLGSAGVIMSLIIRAKKFKVSEEANMLKEYNLLWKMLLSTSIYIIVMVTLFIIFTKFLIF